jgi:hypothetical protein
MHHATSSALAAILFASLTAAALGDPFEQMKPGSPEAKAALAAATRPVDATAVLGTTLPEVKLDRVPLSDAIDGLRDLTGGNISLNEAALAAAGVGRATPVTLQMEKVTVAEALEAILKPLADKGVRYQADKEAMYVSTKLDLEALAAFRERHAALLAAPGPSNPRLVITEGESLHRPNVRYEPPGPMVLREVLADLSRRSGVEIRADMDVLAQTGIKGKQIIRLQLRNPTLGDALTQVLWKTGQIHELDLEVDGMTITVVPRVRAKAA